MEKFLEIATNISTPLALAGLFATVFFFILRQIIGKNTFPAVVKAESARLIQLIITYLFILSLVAMILGFMGFVIVHLVPSNRSQFPDSSTVAIPEGTNLGSAIRMLAEMDDAAASFDPSCTEAIQKLHVEQGPLRAKDTSALMEQLAHRLEPPSSITLRARKNSDRGIYEIFCTER